MRTTARVVATVGITLWWAAGASAASGNQNAGGAPATSTSAVAVTPIPTPAERLASAEAAFGAAGQLSDANARQVAQLVALYRVRTASWLLSPADALKALDQLSTQLRAAAAAEPLLEAEIDNARAEAELRAGDGTAAAAIWRQLGVVEQWQAVGPFDNSSPAAIETNEGPEKGVDLSAHYTGKQRSVGWRAVPFAAPEGELNLGAYLSPAESASAYLVSWVDSPRAQAVAVRLRESGSTRVWINGRQIFDEQAIHPSSGFDQHAAGGWLAAGWNEILVKVGDTQSADWRFSLRLTTPAGAPLALASTDQPPAAVVARVTDSSAAAAPAVADLTTMAQKLASSSPAAELNYAWVLSQKKNFNTGDQDDANAFMSAIAQLPNDTAAVLDFVANDTDQSRQYRYLEQLLERDPGNAQAHQLLGAIELSRNEYWPARQEFETALGMDVEPDTPAGAAPAAAVARAPLAALGMLEVYAGVGVRPEVLAWAEALHPVGSESAAIAAPVATVLEHMGVAQLGLSWFEAAHAADAGDASISLALAQAQRQAGDLEASLTTLRQASALAGSPPSLEEDEARALSGLGQAPAALATIGATAAAAPDSPGLRVAEGEIDSHFGHQRAAVAAWQAALNLNPQDSDLRDRLRLAQGSVAAEEASFERPYAQDLATVMTAYKQQANPTLESGPVVVLADTSVVNIFPSGNIGRYEQQIFRVNNSAGADSLSVYPVTYDPETEEVHFLTAHVVHADGTSADAPQAGDQPVSQSVGYETFYNVRNKYVEMPPLRTGDFVEIAYRVLPTTLESLYGDYYGDLDQFGGPAPTLFQQYVVITPANKPLYFKAVRFNGTSSQHTAQGQTVYQWSARNLAAQVPEPSAPPQIEESPYIEVSSFQTWDQFASWYTQLIRDTFVMDDEMVQTVNQLVQGKTTEEEKVDAIYRWVIQETHYVALEFGIHGYRPYPVTEVFHRRFGDCKDKASLLIAMLHQAGIESDFVLVRVRELGVVDPAIPSVADFDHAIVYVPSLHRYLDGTSEFSGSAELPAGDQRAFVLRMPVNADLGGVGADAPVSLPAGPANAAEASTLAPVVTAEQPPSANTASRTLNGQIDGNGDLHFEMTWILNGGQAPEFRGALELPDRQAGVLQAMLHDRLPGIDIMDATVTGDNDWDQPLEIKMEGMIPRFATVNGSTLLIPRQIVPRAWLPAMAALATRQTDVLTDPPEVLQEVMHLALPPGYQMAPLPPVSNVSEPFASFQADATLNGGTLTLKSQVVTKQSLIPPAEYGAFRSFWAGVDATLGRPLSSSAPVGGAQ